MDDKFKYILIGANLGVKILMIFNQYKGPVRPAQHHRLAENDVMYLFRCF